MAIKEEDVLDLKVEKFTQGGHTYYLELKEKPGYWQGFCYRPTIESRRRGMRCAQPAGANTDHPGTGACYLHGGNSYLDVKVNKVTKGNNRVIAFDEQVRNSLKTKVNKYMAKDNGTLLDLAEELAITRAVLSSLMERTEELLNEDVNDKLFLDYVKSMNATIANIGKVADSISKIQQRNTLTAAHILYLKTVFADLLMKYIEEPDKREEALVSLGNRISGGNADNGKLVIMS